MWWVFIALSMFFPLGLHGAMGKRPWVTITVIVLCVSLHLLHESGKGGVIHCQEFLSKQAKPDFVELLNSIPHENGVSVCAPLLDANNASYNDQHIFQQRYLSNPDTLALIKKLYYNSQALAWYVFYNHARMFNNYGLKDSLSYESGSFNIVAMISSAFAHADRWHLVFNLIFFWAFGCVVELIVGAKMFIRLILLTAIAESVVFSLGYKAGIHSLGLSGVCSTMLGAIFVLCPTARINTFVWFLSIMKVIQVPVYVFGLWYIGWDIYDAMYPDPWDYTNHSAHLTGAFIGILYGVWCRHVLRWHGNGVHKPVVIYTAD